MPNLRGLKGTLHIIKWFADGVTRFRPLKFKPADRAKKEKLSLKSQQADVRCA